MTKDSRGRLENNSPCSLIESSFLKAIQIICHRLSECRSHWVVTGSLGLALQGLDVAVHDIDLQTDKQGAYEIEEFLDEYIMTHVHYKDSEKIRSHFGVLNINGVQVEIMGDLQKKLSDQKWEEPVNIEAYKIWVEFSGTRIPVLSMEYEYQAYLTLKRYEKAEKIRRWLENK